MTPYILGTIGLLLDMLGACLVAYEVVLQFQGKKYRDIKGLSDIKDEPLELPEYTKWEGRKYKFMLRGLVILALGCFVQILGIWLGYKASVETQSQQSPPIQAKTTDQPSNTPQ